GKNTENRREVSPYDFKKRGVNHSCGDEITISMRVRDGVIDDIAFIGDGCMISMASTSIMIDLVKGKEVEEAKRIVDIFIKMIRREVTEDEISELGDGIVFQNIQNMPARVKCATLAWHTLNEIIQN
ncbi:SUF system FeS assembly protein, NifU family, partial [Candidatus Arthromitus sp. SFB-5]